MAHTIYSNFYLSNEIEDQFNSYLDLQQFCTIDRSLEGEPGMIRKINRYQATSATEKLTMGHGNTQSIEVSYEAHPYTIQLAQNKFLYFDEQAMTDPMLVPVGTKHMATDMFNTMNDDLYAEFMNTSQTVSATAFGFDMFADGVAKMNREENMDIFGFVCPADLGKIRKALKDDLKYVEAFSRTGYVGTVCGINLYTKKDATPGTVVIATKEAVTLFTKKGTEVEQERDADTRENRIFSRKYYVAALTDATKAVKIIVSAG